MKYLFQQIQQLTNEEADQIEQIVEQVSVPEEVPEIAEAKLESISKKFAFNKIKEFKEFLYDPSARAARFRRSVLVIIQMISKGICR